MKTAKLFVLIILILCATALVGCIDLHTHNYSWVFGENPDLAFEICSSCLHIRNVEEEYDSPVSIELENISGTYLYPVQVQINIDSGSYDYNDEIEITVLIDQFFDHNQYYLGGELRVKIAESEYYEIVGQDEYIVDNFSTDIVNGNCAFKFIIKVTKPCNLLQKIVFNIKIPITDSYYAGTEGLRTGPEWSCSKNEEYNFSVYSLGFMADSKGVILGKWYYDRRLFFDSVNREYLSGELSKDNYIDRIYEFYYNDSFRVDIHYVNDSANKPYFEYSSKNIRAELYITSNRDYLISLAEEQDNREESRTKLAKLLLKTLYDGRLISEDEYENEIKYIETRDPQIIGSTFLLDYMAPKDYLLKNNIDYVYVEDQNTSNNAELTNTDAAVYKAYCECGSYITQLHSWKIELGQSTCKHCNYVSTGPVLKDDIPIIGDDPLLYEE